MKTKNWFCALAIALFSCAPQSDQAEGDPEQKAQITSSDSLSFDWLLGSWIRVNQKDSTKTTFENWNKKSESEYNGLGYTLQNSDTVWLESVVLNRTDQGWSFDVTAKGDPEPTAFKLTSITPGAFVCENPENEFPTKIMYEDRGDTLHAKVLNSEMEILFDFVKTE